MYALHLDSNASSGNNRPICHTLCKDEEELSVFNESSIGCDICYAWFHFGCLKMTSKKLEEISESSWYCSLCSEENVYVFCIYTFINRYFIENLMTNNKKIYKN